MGNRYMLTRIVGSIILCAASACIANEAVWTRRVEAHLHIGDKQSAVEDARRAVNANPDSLPLKCVLIKALAKAGLIKESLKTWQIVEPSIKDERQKSQLIEEIAWGVIQKEWQSNSLSLKGMAMLAAAVTQDVNALEILEEGLTDHNSLIRAVAVELSSMLNDRPLQKHVLRLLESERVWDVRLEAILATGEMQLKEAEPKLTAILADERTYLEEKIIAAMSIVNIREKVQRHEISSFAKSNRAGLRLLACQLAAKFDRVEDLDLISPLLQDARTEVRIEALNTFGLLRADSVCGKKAADLIESCLREADYRVAITAAWAMALYDSEKAGQFFLFWLKHPHADVRAFAAAGLASTGAYGEKIALRVMKESDDPFVKINIGLGLLGQRIAVNQVCEEIFNFLMMQQKLLMWTEEENRLFQVLAPSNIRRSGKTCESPEVSDQMVRLELLRLLAVMGYPKTQLAVKRFLKEKNWGITGAAAKTLIEEGDEEAVDLVRALLDDEDPKIRIQAALVLALWSKEAKAVNVLQGSYQSADRDLKLKILEALGHIGAPESIPFLVNALQDPFAMIRVIAASSLIICLNH